LIGENDSRMTTQTINSLAGMREMGFLTYPVLLKLMELDFQTIAVQSHPIPLKNPVCEKNEKYEQNGLVVIFYDISCSISLILFNLVNFI
jgi:hypothetical protein